jgi:hypothetical protein
MQVQFEIPLIEKNHSMLSQFAEHYERHLSILEARIIKFLLRTHLKIEDAILVDFKGKLFPQWIGAVRHLPGYDWLSITTRL